MGCWLSSNKLVATWDNPIRNQHTIYLMRSQHGLCRQAIFSSSSSGGLTMTVFMLSIHSASMSPSSTIHWCLLVRLLDMSRNVTDTCSAGTQCRKV